MKFIKLCNLFVVALFICLSMKDVSSLKCYECESLDPKDTSCTKLDPHVYKICPERSVCRVLKAGTSFIRRSCGALVMENIEEFFDRNNQLRSFNEGIPVSSMICNTDLCNGAAAILKTSSIIFISAILLLLAFVY